MSVSAGKPQNRILLPVTALREGAVHLEGELPPSVVDLEDDPRVIVRSGIRYHLDAQLLGSEILVQGAAEVDLDLECARSGAFFSTTVGDSSFLRAYLISDVPESLDLTEEVRDAVVIEIPPFPKSPEAESEDFALPGLSQEDQVGDVGAGSAWSALDDLDLS